MWVIFCFASNTSNTHACQWMKEAATSFNCVVKAGLLNEKININIKIKISLLPIIPQGVGGQCLCFVRRLCFFNTPFIPDGFRDKN